MELKNRFHLTYCEEYGMWLTMLRACYSPKSSDYKNFGAKGIKMGKIWQNFDNFIKDTPYSYSTKPIHFVTTLKEGKRYFTRANTIIGKKGKDDVDSLKWTIFKKYLPHKGTLNNYAPRFFTFASNLKFLFDIDWIISFDDPEKLKRLLRYARIDTKTISHKFEAREYYEEFVNHFYDDPQFNKIYQNWIKSNKDGRLSPVLDHIHPKSKGGSHKLDNLRFITNIENSCKGKLSTEEWEEVKTNPEKFFI